MAYKKHIAGITIEIDGDTSKLVKSLDQVSSKIERVGKKIEGVGKDLTRNLTTPIIAAFGGIIKTTADFDSQMSRVQAISGATAEEFQTMRDKAREMGETTKFSATESGEAFEYMAMAGWKSQEMLDGIEGIMNLAAASGEELGTTSDIVTDALTAFGMSADQSGRFADILASAATNANTNVSMMGESFKYVAPVAGALGYSAEDVAIALGLMANSGIKADLAGTSLRNMFNRMAKPTKESAAAMERLGLTLYDDEGKMYSFRDIMDQLRSSMSNINIDLGEYNTRLDNLDAALEDGTITQKEYDKELEELNLQTFGAEGAEKARAAAMLGGTRAMSGLLAIANASEEDYQQLTKAIDESSNAYAKLADGSVVPLSEAMASGQEIIEQYNGAAEAMANTMQNNLAGQLTILKSQLQELAISLGDLIMPLAREIVSKIQGIVDWLNALDDSQKETILKIAAVVAAVGPALIIIGKVVTGIGSIISVASGLIAAISAISAPVLIVIGVITALIAIGVALYKHWDDIKEGAKQLGEVFSKVWGDITKKVTEAWENVKTKTSEAMNNIKDKIANSQIAQAASKVWDAMKTTVSNSMDAIKRKYDEHGGGLKGAVAASMEAIKQYYQAGFNFIDNLTGGKLSAIRDKVSNVFSSIVDHVRNAVDRIRNAFNFDWHLPHISLPHFSIDGEFSLDPPSVPHFSIDWYKKAMNSAYMLNGATIFGASGGHLLGGGEAGSEMIIGTNKLMQMIGQAKGGNTYNNQFVINGVDRDPQELAQEISYYLDMQLQRTSEVFA